MYGQDETNAQFVSRPNKTRAELGAKRVRLLGVGVEKPQITVRFTMKETGHVVELHQLIFGGITNRCEPQAVPPANTYYAHTDSHWQTPDSYTTMTRLSLLSEIRRTLIRMTVM